MSFAASHEELLTKAQAVLEGNWVRLGTGLGFTKPAKNIYPFQWNWDSAFIAYGYVQYDLDRAITELRSLFLGQWQNGMLPHIVFHQTETNPVRTYFPSPEMWCVSEACSQTSPHVLTSGITQPPLQAVALWRIYKHLRQQDPVVARELLQEFYPKLKAHHAFLHRARDPEQMGLITIFHPWESGLDNSPRWDEALARVEPVDMSPYTRQDTNFVAKKNRPSDDEYGRYLQLLFHLRDAGYDSSDLYDSCPFKVKDIVFSSILYMANKRLWRMGQVLGEDTSDIDGWMSHFETGLQQYCWHEDDKMFYDWDVISGQQVPEHTVASLMPIAAGVITRRQKAAVENMLNQTHFCGEQACHLPLAPSTALHDDDFNHELYWRGPIWINMNWFLWKGFLESNMEDVAFELKDAMLELMMQSGFREYYSPKTGEGLGAEDFSWSAALAIDLLHA